MQNILLVDKPADWTSFDVVNYVRRKIAVKEGKKPKNIKVGHTGTLDPFATGLLILLIGKESTRRASEYSKLDKTYQVTLRLGKISSTGDPEGDITQASPHKPSTSQLESAIRKFTGTISQVPPAYSAIKVNGQRAYKLARAGQTVVIEPRPVTIHKLEITDYNYPEVKLLADVSSGTYIRSLVESIGQELKTGAYTTQLRRTSIGDYDISDAKSVADSIK
jgi:tRNA pseudouridine55 synthase